MEMNDPASRPALAEPAPELSGYDTVFLGFPIWWYVEPRIVDAFLESGDFTGKTLLPFATSGGSGIGGAEKNLRAQYPGLAWGAGKLVNGGAAAWARRALNT